MDYDAITSKYYAAYRPALHDRILEKSLGVDRTYRMGLDIGCGTGASTQALKNYCNLVIGIDPSLEMLENTVPSLGIKYLPYNPSVLEFENSFFDIISFAGSLYYAKSQRLLNELIRVSKKGATIVVYDFKINLSRIHKHLKIPSVFEKYASYNHEEDFSGLKIERIDHLLKNKEVDFLKVSLSNTIHLLLSDKETYSVLAQKYGDRFLEEKLQTILRMADIEDDLELPVILYYNLFNVI